jgi:hypothetical protein
MEWTLGTAPPLTSVIDLTLTNVAALTLDLKDAGIAHGPATLNVTSDGSVVVKAGGTTYSLSAGTQSVTVK